ncbi:hypothetical protein MBLNU459_g2219t1 [Dothideomycetes sp. NU459]
MQGHNDEASEEYVDKSLKLSLSDKIKTLESGQENGIQVCLDDCRDPLNWPLWLKGACLVQVGLLAALGSLNTAIINPAYTPMAKELDITVQRASYQTTVCIALNGIGPFFYVPLANVYGRRPAYLFTTFLGFVSALGSSYAQSFGQLLVARVFNGLFPVAFSLGAVTCVDLFPIHQRGRAIGIFTVIMTNGAHVAPIIAGPIGEFLGWRWTFRMSAIFDAMMLVIIIFCLPETLYVRRRTDGTATTIPFSRSVYLQKLKLIVREPSLKLQPRHFIVGPLKMARYPSVIFPALYYASCYGFASILPAVTVTAIFTKAFHWDTLDIGLGYGAALTIGSFLGELAGGMVVDAVTRREKRRLGGVEPEPEIRLKAIWTGEILVPVGLLIYGFCIQYGTPWIAPLLGMGIACFGLQVVTVTSYTYALDCYRNEGSEVSLLFNFVRQEIGMTFAFYVLPMCKKIGYQWTFLFFALCFGVLAFIPILTLMFRGTRIRQRYGEPRGINPFDTDVS